MYPYIHITLPSYGVMAFIGGFFVLLFIFFRLEKYQIAFFDFLILFALGIVGGIVGSKLMFAITQIPWLIDNFTLKNLIMLIPQSGYVYYGGLFGVLLALRIAVRKNTDKGHRVFRLIIPAIPLFHGFGRIGCMMAGCCYGKKLSGSLYVGMFGFDRIPVQLIESTFEFFMFAFFCVLEKRESKHYSLGNYLVLYAIFRFIIEFFRGDEVRGLWFGGFSTAQYVSVIIIIVAVAYRVCGRLDATRQKSSKFLTR